MTTIAATEAKNRFGELLEAIQRSPVEIAKKGRAVAVVLSIREYEAMMKRLGEIGQPTDFSWLRKWRENANKNRKADMADLTDYHHHLDEKYGA